MRLPATRSFLTLLALCLTASASALRPRYSVVLLEGDVIAGRLTHELMVDSPGRTARGQVTLGVGFGVSSGIVEGSRVVVEKGDILGGEELLGVALPAVNASGELAFVGTFPAPDLTGQRTSIVLGNTLLFSQGDPLGDLELLDFLDLSLADDGTLAFIARARTQQPGSEHTVLVVAGQLVVSEGDLHGGQLLGPLDSVTINSAGDVFFSATLSGVPPGRRAVFDLEGLRHGPGTSVGPIQLLGAHDPSINDAGQLVFLGRYLQEGRERRAVFSPSGLRIAEGEEVDGIRVEKLVSTSIDASGLLCLGARFRDDTPGIIAPVDFLSDSSDAPSLAFLGEDRPTALFKLPGGLSGPLEIRLGGAGRPFVQNLLFRAGRPPGPGLNDANLVYPHTTTRHLVLSSVPPGPGFVRVVGRELSQGPHPVELSFRPLTLSLTGISMERSAPDLVEVAITGGGLTSDLTLSLVPTSGQPAFPALSITRLSDRRIETSFDLREAPPGSYDLVARHPGGTPSTLPGAFEVLATRQPGRVEVELLGMEYARYNRPARFDLLYRNTGDHAVTAPLLLVQGPPGTRFALEGRREFLPEKLLVLGIDPDGIPGILPPGKSGRIPVYFKSSRCGVTGPEDDPFCQVSPPELCPCQSFPSEDCTFCDIGIRVSLFRPPAFAVVGWDRIEPPPRVDRELWDRLWPHLSRVLGPTWSDVHRGFAQLANRLARRDMDVTQVLNLYRFLVLEALGGPTAAVIGRLEVPPEFRRKNRLSVFALEADGTVASSVFASPGGEFAIPWLEEGATYRLAVGDHEIESLTPGEGDRVTLPPQGDLHGVEVVLRPGETDIEPGCANCEFDDLPSRPLIPPLEHFVTAGLHRVILVSSWDPNDKDGPVGEGDDKLIPRDTEIVYTIYFENLPAEEEDEIVAAANVVELVDVLDEGLDLETFEPREIRIGSDEDQVWSFDLDGDDRFSDYAYGDQDWGNHHYLEIEVRHLQEVEPGFVEEKVHDVQVYVNLEVETRTLRVTFQSQFDFRDPLGGFLPPNDDLHQGEGQFSFAIRHRADLPDDTDLRNRATIGFDNNPEVIETPEWVNRVSDSILPTEPVEPSPRHLEADVPLEPALQWISENAESYSLSLWLLEGEEEVTVFEGELDHAYHVPDSPLEAGQTYRWQVTARNGSGDTTSEPWEFTVTEQTDCPGNVDDPVPSPEATPEISPPELSWREATDATGYEVYLWPADQERPEEALVTGIVEARLPLVEPLENGRHLWQVISVNETSCRVEGPVWAFTIGGDSTRAFRRLDVDANGLNEITDSIFLLGHLFLGDDGPPCQAAADVNDDGLADITDAINILSHLFLGTFTPPEPFTDCATDAGSPLGCESFPPCEEG